MKNSSFYLLLLVLSPIFGFAQSADTYLNKGKEEAFNGQYKSAIRNFDKAIKLNPTLAEAYYQRGHVKYDLKDYEGAIEDCTQAIDLDSTFTDAYFNLAISKLQLEDYYGAILNFDQALKLDKEDAESYCWRGIAKFKVNLRKEACKDWQKANQLGNSYVHTYLNNYCGEENQAQIGN